MSFKTFSRAGLLALAGAIALAILLSLPTFHASYAQTNTAPAATTTVAVNYPCPQFLPLSWMPLTDVCKTDKYSTAGNLTVTMSQQVQ